VDGLGIAQMVQDFGASTIKKQESLCASKIIKDTQGGKLLVHLCFVPFAYLCLAIAIAGGIVSAAKDFLPGPEKLVAGVVAGLATSIGGALNVSPHFSIQFLLSHPLNLFP